MPHVQLNHFIGEIQSTGYYERTFLIDSGIGGKRLDWICGVLLGNGIRIHVRR